MLPPLRNRQQPLGVPRHTESGQLADEAMVQGRRRTAINYVQLAAAMFGDGQDSCEGEVTEDDDWSPRALGMPLHTAEDG